MRSSGRDEVWWYAVTGMLQPAKQVDVFEPRTLRLVRTQSPSVSARHRIVLDQMWAEAVRSNPHLYDGPSIVVAHLDRLPGELVLRWAPVTYRYFMLRRAGVACLPGLFAAVIQPTDTGGMLIGRSSSATSVPGRVHLPGGVVEPPSDPDADLDVVGLAREAARELAEETGISTPSESFTFCLVTQAVGGNVGVIFRAPPLPESVIRDGFAEHRGREVAAGRAVEFDGIEIVSTMNNLVAMGGPYADSVIPVLRHVESMMKGAPPSSRPVQ
jgi:8-oxo-dGTP pyrophosphatase MutT (NUDIX family)